MNSYGTQRFQVNSDVHINFQDKGGLMGIELLPIEQGDEDIYDIITITSPLKWTPHKFVTRLDDGCYYDPTDALQDAAPNYPAHLNHLSIKDGNLGENDLPDDPACQNDQYDMTDMTLPIMESHVLATATWHRVTHKDISPNLLRPYL